MTDGLELSIVMPCLNEAETLETCIGKAQDALRSHEIEGEIIVADNGSNDGSREIAQRCGVRLLDVPHKGYGAALRAGIAAARGRYVIMGDSDDSYDFGEIWAIIQKLREGNVLVSGTRIKGTIMPGAMPWLHRHVGNPVLTGIGNIFFRTQLSDYHSGMRGFNRQAIQDLGLRTTGMEFATEMIAKAALHKLPIAEVPITYYPDGRTRAPHLRTWHDGWRHLRFMLLLSPAWTLLFPGLLLLVLGILGIVLIGPGTLVIGSIGLDVHTLLVSGVAIIIGTQLLSFWLIARMFASSIGLIPLPRALFRIVKGAPLGTGLTIGGILVVLGLFPAIQSIRMWTSVQFGQLDYRVALRYLIPGLILVALGIQSVVTSFIISMMNFTENMLLGD